VGCLAGIAAEFYFIIYKEILPYARKNFFNFIWQNKIPSCPVGTGSHRLYGGRRLGRYVVGDADNPRHLTEDSRSQFFKL
jgi:hypothetical protein